MIEQYGVFHSEGWRGIAASGFPLPAPQSLLESGTAVIERPDRMVRRMQIDGRSVYAKFVWCRGNCLLRLFRAFRRLFGIKSARRIYLLHLKLRSMGFGCPRPLAALTGQGGSQLFLAEDASALSVAQWLKRDVCCARDLLGSVASELARLHRAGFVHGDCIPYNLLLDEQHKVIFIDNDRTRHISFGFRRYQRRKNLIQFCSHLLILPGVEDWMAEHFLLRYFDAFGEEQDVPEFISIIRRRIKELEKERRRK